MKPVPVGSIAEFSTAVVYSRGGLIVVQVEAFSVNCKTLERTKTNVFSYVFKSPKQASSVSQSTDGSNKTAYLELNSEFPQVIPREYDEFVLFLEGKRAYERLVEANGHGEF